MTARLLARGIGVTNDGARAPLQTDKMDEQSNNRKAEAKGAHLRPVVAPAPI